MLSHRVHEAGMNRAVARVEALDAVQGGAVRIRMEALAG
jgi:hypothetical protein